MADHDFTAFAGPAAHGACRYTVCAEDAAPELPSRIGGQL